MDLIIVSIEVDDTKNKEKQVQMKPLIDGYGVTMIPVSKDAKRLAGLYVKEGIILEKYYTDAWSLPQKVDAY